MLQQVEVFSARPSMDPLVLKLTSAAAADPIQIRKIDGLGPVKAAVTSSPFGVIDGEALSGASTGKRNIVMTLGLSPNWVNQSMAELRNLLYQYFMPKATVSLRITSSHISTCSIEALVESIEPNIFAKDAEVQVSLLCMRPDFVAVDPTVINGRVGDLATEVEYEGTVKTGFMMQVLSSAERGAYTGMLDISTDALVFERMTLNNITVDASQRFEMNSVPGNKYVRTVTIPGGVKTNKLAQVVAGGKWLTLLPGATNVRVIGDLPGLAWQLSYYARFGGL